MQNPVPFFTSNIKYILIVHVYYDVQAIINFQLYFRKIITFLTIIRTSTCTGTFIYEFSCDKQFKCLN